MFFSCIVFQILDKIKISFAIAVSADVTLENKLLADIFYFWIQEEDQSKCWHFICLMLGFKFL